MKTPQDTAKQEPPPSEGLGRSKPTRKEKASCTSKAASLKDRNERIETIEKNIKILEFVISKIAHFSGNNRVLIEAGMDVWVPGTKDMRKFKS